MGKLVILYGMICVAFLGYLFVIPSEFSEATPVQANQSHDAWINDMDLDPSEFLIEQKERIYSQQLTYVDSFNEINYMFDSSNQYRFQRDWSLTSYLDTESEPKQALQGHVFKDDDNNYHLMLNYTLNNNQTFASGEESHQDYLTLEFSKHYELTNLNTYYYYVFEGNEYLAQSFSKSQVYQNNTVENRNDSNSFGVNEYYNNLFNNPNIHPERIYIPRLTASNYFKQTELKGYTHITLQSAEGYESDLFESIIDYYESTQANQKKVVLGFNAFNETPDRDLYIPSSYKVTHIKERD